MNDSIREQPELFEEFESKIFKHKDKWLPYKFGNLYNAGMHSYTKLATIKDQFKSSCKNQSLENKDFSVFQILDKISELEKINETFHFKFNKQDESVKHVTNSSPLYISIKKAFTPFAVLHMLRQIQIAFSLKEQIVIEDLGNFYFEHSQDFERDMNSETIENVLKCLKSKSQDSDLFKKVITYSPN